jgi:glycosyltransferase involved in cell wall biosynthesis
MIVKDEGRFLKRCIESVKPIVSEIIVVDTGSRDDTQAIALALGAKLFQFRWEDDFSAARNFSLEKATKDWILVLDGDEVISPKDLEAIKKLVARSDFEAYSFIQRNYFKDKQPTMFELSTKGDAYEESKPYSGWLPSELVRLFRNHKGYGFAGAIHELVEPAIRKAGGKMGKSNIPLHHFRAERPAGTDEGKKKRYLELGMRQIELTPDEPKPYFEVGMIHLDQKEYDKAIAMLEKSLLLIEQSPEPKLHTSTYSYVLFALGKAFFETGQLEKGYNMFRRLSERNPFPAVFFFMGLSAARLGRFGDAIVHYQKAIELNPSDEELHNNLGNLLGRLGRFQEAIAELEKALSLAPDNAVIQRNLAAAYAGAGKYGDALNGFRRSIELAPEFEAELAEGLKELEGLIAKQKEQEAKQ